MIEITYGDMFTASVEALVNPVNCVGATGRGLAPIFCDLFPAMNQEYVEACQRRVLRPGTVIVHNVETANSVKYVVSFPTKDHWRGKSTLAYIRSGLSALVLEVDRVGIESIAIPALGCGLGGLQWDDVRPLIESAFSPHTGVRVLLYAPHDDRPSGAYK